MLTDNKYLQHSNSKTKRDTDMKFPLKIQKIWICLLVEQPGFHKCSFKNLLLLVFRVFFLYPYYIIKMDILIHFLLTSMFFHL